jgi:Insect cuticle protein
VIEFFFSFHLQLLAFTTLVAVATCRSHHHNADDHHHVGYSYAKFSGPVSGHESEVPVVDKYGHSHHTPDYVAKPDYAFEYGVEDPKTHVSQNRHEQRHDDQVQGEYSLVQPDGKTRTVKYLADDHHGFRAEVFIDGKPLYV